MPKGKYPDVPNILIVGPSGSGKSSSARNLDRETTGVLNIERKKMPFPGPFTNEFWIPERKGSRGRRDDEGNVRPSAILEEARACLDTFIDSPEIDLIVYESFTKHDRVQLASSRIAQSGYDIYNEHNAQIQRLIDRTQDVGKPIVFMAIDEVVTIAGVDETRQALERRCKVLGRELEGTIEYNYTIVLHTLVRQISEEEIEYVFVTNNDGERSAKTPAGMFDDLYIENDLAAVLDRIQEYYSAPAPRAKSRKKK